MLKLLQQTNQKNNFQVKNFLIFLFCVLSYTAFSQGNKRVVVSTKPPLASGINTPGAAIGSTVALQLDSLAARTFTLDTLRKFLYVSELGNNGTAVKGSIINAWRDPWAARMAADSNDIIYVLPGEYSIGDVGSGSTVEVAVGDRVVSPGTPFGSANNANLLKDHVNYIFEKGASVVSQMNTSAPLFISTPDEPALESTVTGFGTFVTKQNTNSFMGVVINDINDAVPSFSCQAQKFEISDLGFIISGVDGLLTLDTLDQNNREAFLIGAKESQGVKQFIYDICNVRMYPNPVGVRRLRPFLIDGYNGNIIKNQQIYIRVGNMEGEVSQVLTGTLGTGSTIEGLEVTMEVFNQSTFAPVPKDTLEDGDDQWFGFSGAAVLNSGTTHKNNRFNLICHNCRIGASLFGGSVVSTDTVSGNNLNNKVSIRGNFTIVSNDTLNSRYDRFSVLSNNLNNTTSGLFPFYNTEIDVNLLGLNNTYLVKQMGSGAKGHGAVTISGDYKFVDTQQSLIVSRSSASNLLLKDITLRTDDPSLPLIGEFDSNSILNISDLRTNIAPAINNTYGQSVGVLQSYHIR